LTLRGGRSEGQGNEGEAMEVDGSDGVGVVGEYGGDGMRDVVVKWKGRSLAISINVNQPASLIKHTLWQLSEVLPEHQFLLGVYKQGQDTDLSTLGIKSGQSLVLLGDATLGSLSREGVAPPEEPKAFVSTLGRFTKEEIDSLDTSPIAVSRRKAARAQADGTSSTGLRGTSIEEEEARGDDLVQTIAQTLDIDASTRTKHLDQVPATLPKEFWAKKLGNLTVEEGEQLKEWINKTRAWKIQTKMDRSLAKNVNLTRALREERRDIQRDIEAYVDAEEADLNTWGLSRIKSQIVSETALQMVASTDLLENVTTLNTWKRHLIGGMNFDDSARFIENIDEIEAYVDDAIRRDNHDAVTQMRYERLMEPELERRALEDPEEPSSQDQIPEEYWDEWIRVLKEHPYYPKYKADLAKPLQEVPPSFPMYEVLKRPRVDLIEKIERMQKRGDLRDWVNYGWHVADRLPNGLVNIGNTCYMAGAMQMLRCVPELMRKLKDWTRTTRNTDVTDNLLQAAQMMYGELADKEEGCSPHTFMYHVRELLPQFSQMGPMGPQQQDAEEFLTAVLQAFSQKLKTESGSNLIKDLFEIELETQTWCIESLDEEPTYDTQRVLRLSLPIDKSCTTLHDSLAKCLTGQLEKHSPTLNRTAVYNQSMEVSHLPPYVMMQYMRFYWRTDTNKKAKICKNVHFPLVIDLLDYLCDEFKTPIKLQLAKRKSKFFQKKAMWQEKDVDEMPRKWAEWDRKEAERQLMIQMGFLNGTLADLDPLAVEETESSEAANRTEAEFQEARKAWLKHIGAEDEEEAGKEGVEEKEEADEDKEEAEKAPPTDPSLEGASTVTDSAMYQLRAVLAHQSRYADAGHYVTYVRTSIRQSSSWRTAPEPMWIKFDDDKVTLVKEDEVRNTAGGADNPISYVCLYARSEAVVEGLSSTQY